MRFLFFAILIGACANATAADIPADVRAAFDASAKENARQIERIKSDVAILEATRRRHDPNRTREQAQALANRSKQLHDELAERQKTVPPMGLWNAFVPMEPGRIGLANVRARIVRIIDTQSVEAIQFTSGAPMVSDVPVQTERHRSGHTIGQPFVVRGIDTAKFTTGAIVDEFPGVFRVDRTNVRGKTLFELSSYDAVQLRDYFDRLQAEAKKKQ